MRTVKHKLKPLSLEQKIQFLDLARAYQFEKNYWSDQLLDGSTDEINLKNLYTYQQIRNSKNLTKNNYYSHYNLPVRYCTIALKEAYDLHIRTYESQISFLKRDVNNKIYKFSYTNTGINMSSSTEPNISEDKKESVAAGKAKAMLLNTFKEFLYFTTNSLFYNYKTFRTFEEDFYSKKFRKARIYQRIQPILKKLFGKAMSEAKDVFQLNQVEENNTDQLSLLEENIEILNKFLLSEAKTACSEVECLEELLNYYCNCLVKAVVKFRNFKPIQSQINPTITLDGGCYKLYSKYDETAKKNRWFLDIMSMEVGKRIKGLELTGFHHAKKIMKHKKYPNLTLSFDRTDMTYYAHFTFGTFDTHPSHKARKSLKTRKASKQQRKLNLCQRSQVSDGNGEVKSIQYKLTKDKVNFFYKKHTKNMVNASLLMTMLTVGGDFGVTENYTFSDGWVSGRKQGKILHYISNSTKNSVAGLQRISEKGFFGVEKNNPTGQRNHKNNCFNLKRSNDFFTTHIRETLTNTNSNDLTNIHDFIFR